MLPWKVLAIYTELIQLYTYINTINKFMYKRLCLFNLIFYKFWVNKMYRIYLSNTNITNCHDRSVSATYSNICTLRYFILQ